MNKSLISKLLNLPKRIFEDYRQLQFINCINKETWKNNDELVKWSLSQESSGITLQMLENSSEIVKSGLRLRSKVISEYENKYKLDTKDKILVHLPPFNVSPGGYSLFSNLIDSFNFIGIESKSLGWDDDLEQSLESFKPTIFISSDNREYLDRINWDIIQSYKYKFGLNVGLTASIEAYGNTPLIPRLQWAKNRIDFYYSFRPQEYIKLRSDYNPYFEEGYEIFTIEFGANPLCYYPVNTIAKDIDFIFLGSNTRDKHSRFYDYFPSIFNNYSGVLIGQGWNKHESWADKNIHKYMYGRSKIGLNLHGSNQTGFPIELNERTYILAACGIPQLIDNVDLLKYRFKEESLFIAENPKEYLEMFKWILDDPKESEKRALSALDEVYSKYTTFHRVEKFYKQIKK